MLDPWIIEEIRRREEEQRQREQQRSRLEIQIETPSDLGRLDRPDRRDRIERQPSDRGVTIIDFSV